MNNPLDGTDMAINGKALALMAGGGIVLFSGVAGKNVSSAVRDVLNGESPKNALTANTITGQTIAASGGTSGGTLTGPNSALATRAMQDVGHRYHLGGYYADPQGWDCSSACNWWISRFGATLPGGVRGYNGTSHGPVVAMYQLWSNTHAVPRSQVAAGDLVLFGGSHMGIAIDNKRFISAANPSLGTLVADINGFGGMPNFKRIIRL